MLVASIIVLFLVLFTPSYLLFALFYLPLALILALTKPYR